MADMRALTGAGRPLLVGFTALAVLLGGVGLWSVQARIAGAVIASGMIEVESNRQVIQHPQGGVVGALEVRDGDTVQAGDVVLRLDDSALQSELAIVTGQLAELRARKARLEAERDEAAEVRFAPQLQQAAQADQDVAALLDGQVRLFDARRESLAQEEQLLDRQALQNGNQIKGAEAQLRATEVQHQLIEGELRDAQALLDKGLAQAARVSELQRRQAQLIGEVGQIQAQIAQLSGDTVRVDVEKLRLRVARREDAISQLRDLEGRTLELAERELALRETLSRMDVRTPVSGVIYGNRVFALQSVVSPAEPIMYVIPQDQPLIVSARIEAIHIDQVYEGQQATLRFVAFDQRSTPEVFGAVTNLSADVFIDEVTGTSYYSADIVPHPDELDKLEGQNLLPGMPVEAFIKTAERAPLSYLVKPVSDYFVKAFREG